jgi:UDP-N-acetylmuramoyl-L-alanyl-D-glutamate--2,6-diaminopimelate ligase
MSQLRPMGNFQNTLKDLTKFLSVEEFTEDITFTGLTHDSRKVESGDLFLAIPGGTMHGANYVDDVIAKGAVAVLTDKQGLLIVGDRIPCIMVDDPRLIAGDIASWFYQAPFLALDAVGITGTNGKTTTSALLEQLWRMNNRTTGFIGTIGIAIDGEEFESTFTTPEAADLQSIAATMKERHVRNLVMEVSSHALVQHRMNGSKFSVAGFTQLTQDHLDFHGTMENYFLAKSKLFLPEFTEKAVVNIDSVHGRRLFDEAQVDTQSLSRDDKSAQWHYDTYYQLDNGAGYQVVIRGTGGILIEGRFPLLGLHNLDNGLLAIALAVNTGVDPLVISANMHSLSAPQGRLEPVSIGQKFIALVDFAHTPDAVTRALATARQMTHGRLIAVLGCGGDRDKAKRPLMGQALREGADFAIFTSDNPRSEDPLVILNEMVGSGTGKNEIVEVERRGAIAIAVAEADDGDCIIVLGKGHERGQEINGIKQPFDDRIELARAIEGLS